MIALVVLTLALFVQTATAADSEPPFPPGPEMVSVTPGAGAMERADYTFLLTVTIPNAATDYDVPVDVVCTFGSDVIALPTQTIHVSIDEGTATVPVTFTMPYDGVVGSAPDLTITVPEQRGYVVPATPTTVTVADGDSGVYTLSVGLGWNLVSLPIVPINPAAVWSALTGNAGTVTIWQYDAGYTYWAKAGYRQGTLAELPASGLGFWIYADTAYTVTVDYNLAERDFSPRLLTTGWNLVACPYTGATRDTLCPSPGKVLFQYVGSYTYYTTTPTVYRQGTLASVTPGLGYWVYV